MKEVENPAMRTVMGTQWVKEQSERMLRMERLYVLDGRHFSDDPLLGLYTGLYEKAEDLEKDLYE